ncbi:dihydroxy-acid dehydratase [Pseudonocardia sp. NPDC049154]|uniref:dihydroxy-acid dehydratase n=1 Tax=Pseudonocardia sp. NPDC049154 TaxID=3155501 RepID=UPI0033FA392A
MGELRSARWFSGEHVPGFVHRTAMRASGFSRASFEGRPFVGICNSWSELISCNLHLRAIADSVRRGILQAGGVPVEFPTISLGEQLMKPTTMLFRNLMAMDVEESLRGYPFDAVVMLGGCDKTMPAQLMGAASADVPTIIVPGGPANPATFRGRRIGVGTDLWGYVDDVRAGRMSQAEYEALEASGGPSVGHCPEMGTASTVSAVVEALGMTLPGASAIPATDARRSQIAEDCGRTAVRLALDGVRPSRILTCDAFHNAITVLVALGGSTNVILHLLALAGRAEVPLRLQDFHDIAARVPLIANVRPAGEHLVEQLFEIGGLPVVMRELAPLLRLKAVTVSGRTVGENVADAPAVDGEVVRPLTGPVQPPGGLAVVRGNLAPGGAVVKCSAATPELLRHSGPALVFDDMDDLRVRIDDPDLPATADSVLVLRNAGPIGGPGMPEWGALPIPQKLLREGVTDMVRVSDARMSGTAYGTTVLHVAPEAAVGGPLALVEDGDVIRLDARAGVLHLEVDDVTLEARRRRRAEEPARVPYLRGYGALYTERVTQADTGCDFDFLRGRSDDPADEPYGIFDGWIGGW